MWLSSICFLFLIIPILINVAFFTLLERKILGLSQSRKGPNKVSVMGGLQPIADAVKLFIKEVKLPFKGAPLLYLGAPGLALVLMLLCWAAIPSNLWSNNIMFSALFLLTILSMNLYPLVLAGWASMSAYASIGAMRGVAQTLSYEISMALLLMSLFLGNYTLSWGEVSVSSPLYQWPGCFSTLLVAWLICCVAETNRTPFDFSEGESELVSGFNIEYGGGLFALIFMAEYGMMLALSCFTATLVVSSSLNTIVIFFTLVFCFLWVWLRATLPRYRYDKLMKLAWTNLLPLALIFLCFFTLI